MGSDDACFYDNGCGGDGDAVVVKACLDDNNNNGASLYNPDVNNGVNIDKNGCIDIECNNNNCVNTCNLNMQGQKDCLKMFKHYREKFPQSTDISSCSSLSESCTVTDTEISEQEYAWSLLEDLSHKMKKFNIKDIPMPQHKVVIVTRQPLSPASSLDEIWRVEEGKPSGMYTAKGRRTMFRNYQLCDEIEPGRNYCYH